MSEIRTASDIYEQLKTLRWQLDKLGEAGRIVMTRDRHNTDRTESGPALRDALAGLDRAIDATTWMETLAVVEGGYPVLEG
ncbi:hypothetical protein Q2T94_07545 [Paeniglutamicibacter sulfureus]|uniref:hypothetical protein n=1 Tax=Paeniglutamicibacter sulfureus TaxID=43666 RepID=UPI002665C193|nr:hypothetical protein [Paeniglutamicibacter sulfureus]MDO2934148.1 hypothetical protein [Paeniglutamicibacter sulfureus]